MGMQSNFLSRTKRSILLEKVCSARFNLETYSLGLTRLLVRIPFGTEYLHNNANPDESP